MKNHVHMIKHTFNKQQDQLRFTSKFIDKTLEETHSQLLKTIINLCRHPLYNLLSAVIIGDWLGYDFTESVTKFM